MKELSQENMNTHPLNCKIYSNSNVANKLIAKAKIDYNKDFTLLEPAVGTGDIFLLVLEKFIKHNKELNVVQMKEVLSKTFYCFDVDEESLNILRFKIDSLLFENGYDELNSNCINIILSNVFDLPFNNIKFDYIICNPPYIKYSSLTNEQKKYMRKKFVSCEVNKFDMYFVFYEYAINLINDDGMISLISPNSILNSKSGYNLRSLILRECNHIDIDNFLYNVFNDAIVKTIIISLSKKRIQTNKYKEHFSTKEISDYQENYLPNSKTFIPFQISNESVISNSKKIKDYFYVSGGIATLDNHFYMLIENDIKDDSGDEIIFRKQCLDGIERIFKIQKKYFKKFIRPNIKVKHGYVLYLYDKHGQALNESEIDDNNLLHYININKKDQSQLSYGRCQGLKYLDNTKLVIPMITSSMRVYMSSNELIYSGIYFVVKKEYLLQENELFEQLKNCLEYNFQRLRSLSKNLDKKNINLSTTDIKNLSLNF